MLSAPCEKQPFNLIAVFLSSFFKDRISRGRFAALENLTLYSQELFLSIFFLGLPGIFFTVIAAACKGAGDVRSHAVFVFESDSGALGSLKLKAGFIDFYGEKVNLFFILFHRGRGFTTGLSEAKCLVHEVRDPVKHKVR